MPFGLLLSITTAVMWGVLPVALKRVLAVMDAATITWIRLLFATILVGCFYLFSGRWPQSSKLTKPVMGWLFAVGAAMAVNYWLFLAGLDLVPPSVAQLTIQSGPFFLAVGAWLVFAEGLTRRQISGFVVMGGGFLLFYSAEGMRAGGHDIQRLAVGVSLVVIAALAWAIYALVQKKLGAALPSSFVLLAGYAVAGVLIAPLAHPVIIFNLQGDVIWYLLFCCLNTVIAYGCFAEAVKRWDAARVSAILALTPMITYLAGIIEHQLIPEGAVTSSSVGPAQLSGAALVVSGAVLAALSSRRRTNPDMTA